MELGAITWNRPYEKQITREFDKLLILVLNMSGVFNSNGGIKMPENDIDILNIAATALMAATICFFCGLNMVGTNEGQIAYNILINVFSIAFVILTLYAIIFVIRVPGNPALDLALAISVVAAAINWNVWQNVLESANKISYETQNLLELSNSRTILSYILIAAVIITIVAIYIQSLHKKSIKG